MSGTSSGSSFETRAPAAGPGSSPLPADLIRFAELVNERRFWDSHEALEEPWRKGGSVFYHGLILFASAFVHVKRNNRHGIEAQLRKALPRLKPHGPHYLGVNVRELLEHALRCLEVLDARGDQGPERWSEVIPFPTVELDPDRIRGDEEELSAGSHEAERSSDSGGG